MRSGFWLLLNDSAAPPYDPRHLLDTHDYHHRVQLCAQRSPGWRYGWVEEGAGPALRTAAENCELMSGSNLLLIGDSLSQQMYQSWRARLRQQRYSGPGGEAAGTWECRRAGVEWCEGPMPALCMGHCAGKELADSDQFAAHRATCDNGATTFHAQAFRWVLVSLRITTEIGGRSTLWCSNHPF